MLESVRRDVQSVVGSLTGELPGESIVREPGVEWEPIPIGREAVRQFECFMAHVRKIECIVGGEVQIKEGCPRFIHVTKASCTDMPLRPHGVGSPVPWSKFSLPERMFVQTCQQVGWGVILLTIVGGTIKTWEVIEQTVRVDRGDAE